ncbi:MAG: hypothetical protein AB7O26_02790 [Planctomycetaceae bacterium]
MIYEIEDISTDKASGHTYVLVRFWTDEAARTRGDAPILVNDFLMQLRPTGERVVTDEQGRWKRKDGSYIDWNSPQAPEFIDKADLETEPFERDILQEMAAGIERYIVRAEAEQFRGDHTHRDGSPPMEVAGQVVPQGRFDLELDASHDPHGVLAHPRVTDLKEQIAIRKLQSLTSGAPDGETQP